jgi:hypothetical protein
MSRERLATDGFVLALQVIKLAGGSFDVNKVMKLLVEISTGEATLFNSLEEEIKTFEQKLNRPISDEERESMTRLLVEKRRETDLASKTLAGDISRALQEASGEGAVEFPPELDDDL